MERTPRRSGPHLLVVIDGFGLAPPGDGNAITLARTPNWDLKSEGHFVFAGDVLRRIAPSIELVLGIAAVSAFWYLGRTAWSSTYNSRE